MRFSVILGCVGIAVVAQGCSITDPSTTPVELLDRVYAFGPCVRQWSPDTPPVERTVVDLFFANDGAPPTAEQIRMVTHAGGRKLYAFNIPIVRAELDVDNVQDLVGDWSKGKATYARTVVEPANHVVELIVMMSRDLMDSDITAVEALGARVIRRWDFVEGYAVEIDDAAVPSVRALPGVRSVGGNGIGCLA